MASIYFSPQPDTDPEMNAAVQNARSTFKFFWRELYWESRRIVPGLDVACVKVPFRDPPAMPKTEGPEVEQMWINEVYFDGKLVHGTLVNTPHWLTSVKEGDRVEVPLAGIYDWMYAIGGRAFGAWTVNCLRARMSEAERQEHDEAWGLDFGDPAQVQVVPDWKEANPRAFAAGEHPMAWNMVEPLRRHLQQHPEDALSADEDGLTHLHSLALAGSSTSVEILLQHGADPQARTKNGMTARDMAAALGWSEVASMLAAA